jgi:AraC family transcriptional regulator
MDGSGTIRIKAPARRYGDVVTHSIGLGRPPSLQTRTLTSSQIGITRVSCGPDRLGRTDVIPPEDTFIIALYLTEMTHHELWSRGKRFLAQGYAANSMRIVNLTGEFSAHLTEPHESVYFYLPRAALDAFTDEAGGNRIATLACTPGLVDPVMAHLVQAALPGFQRPQEASALFVDHVALAMCAHVALRYGGFTARSLVLRGGLSKAQENRAKEFLSSHFAEDVPVAEVAAASDLSRGHFIRAFKQTTGITPHKWLQRYRIEKAQEFLANTPIPITEIASLCGFADQAHLTRVFSRETGMPPGAWRRNYRS